jgi:hypothetical protein
MDGHSFFLFLKDSEMIVFIPILKKFGMIVIFFPACLPLLAFSATLTPQQQALKDIREFADGICTRIPLISTTAKVEFNGQAKAELTGVVKKLANLGVEGAGNYKSEASQNVLQADLAATVKHGDDCRQRIAEKLIDKMIAFPVRSAVNGSQPHVVKFTEKEQKMTPKANSHATFTLVSLPQSPRIVRLILSLASDSPVQLKYGDYVVEAEVKFNYIRNSVCMINDCLGDNTRKAIQFSKRMTFQVSSKNGFSGVAEFDVFADVMKADDAKLAKISYSDLVVSLVGLRPSVRKIVQIH